MSGLPPGAEGLLEEVACPLCGADEPRERFREDPFRVVRCGRCDLVYVTPRLPAQALVEHVYGEDYWRSPAAKDRGYTDYRADEELYLRTNRRRLRALRAHLPTPAPGRDRALDVGCAAGYFLSVLREAGWQVRGVEPSAPIRATAEQRLGPDVVLAGDAFHPQLEAGSFDLVTLWDVLEHVPDPRALLRRAAELLAPGGRLVLETQDVDSAAARALGRRWTHYKHAEHLVHFSPATLDRALGEAGLERLALTRRGAGKYVSPAFVAERAGRVAPWLQRALTPLTRLAPSALYVNPHDEMIVVARVAAAN